MEKFSDCIPEFPRRSPGIFTLHHKLISSWKRSKGAHRRIVRILGFFAPGLRINRPTPPRIFAIPTEE